MSQPRSFTLPPRQAEPLAVAQHELEHLRAELATAAAEDLPETTRKWATREAARSLATAAAALDELHTSLPPTLVAEASPRAVRHHGHVVLPTHSLREHQDGAR